MPLPSNSSQEPPYLSFSISRVWYVCKHVCMCMGTCEHVCMRACASACGGPGLKSGIIPDCSYSLRYQPLRQGLTVKPKLTNMAHPSLLWGYIPVQMSHHDHPAWYPESEIQSQSLSGEHSKESPHPKPHLFSSPSGTEPWAGGMAQWLTTLTALSGARGVALSTYTVTCKQM